MGREQQDGVFARDRWHEGFEVDRLRGAVIHISVDSDGSISDGSGVALCQIGEQIFVLTAGHVPFPRMRRGVGSGARTVALRKVYRFELARSDVPPVEVGTDEELWVRSSSEHDVAILRIVVENETIRVPPLSFGRSTDLVPGAEVRAFGYASQSARAWEETVGAVVGGGGDLAYTPAVEPGFSGGPVFDTGGHLVGISLSTESGRVTRVLPIETAVAVVDRWLPLPCPRPRLHGL